VIGIPLSVRQQDTRGAAMQRRVTMDKAYVSR